MQEISRRGFLQGSSVASMALFFGSSLPLMADEKDELLGFEGVKISTDDDVKVPKGYEAKVLISWGDPLFSRAKEFDESKKIDEKAANDASLVFGDNNDGMSFFPLDGDKKAIMVINNEYVNPEIMFNHNGNEMSKFDVLYEQNSMGVSIFEVEREKNGYYKVVLDSPYNRRITALTPMRVTGAAKGHESLKTKADPKGELVLGTVNNCANGQTPWGTYLTCEENFDDFFGSSDAEFKLSKSYKRYGLKNKGQGYDWHKFDERFDLSVNPNEPNRFGYIVEIDPFDPNSVPLKRTALGRFKHENCELLVNTDGKVVAYSGDDENNEFVYKFVSDAKFDSTNLKNNKNILESGTLYVAKFDGEFGDFKGSGKWLELSFGKNGLDEKNGFKSQADILINTRLAASIVGATPMDRCEWIAADVNKNFVYATMTNNKKRENADAANPRAKNVYGQIIKWGYKNQDHTSDDFNWEIFALAGNPDVHKGLNKGSNNINSQNKFNSPDGLKFDKFGRLWIQTDGSYSNLGDYEGMGNNQMLCANPKTGEIRRFLTGPVACEITGIAFSGDSKTMFVNIQHPGENLKPSHFPTGKTPRSSVVMIRKTDGGVIGS